MRRRSNKEKEDNRLLRAWKNWHRDQLAEALAGLHRDVLERLQQQLKDLRSARELVDFIAAQDWATVSADVRLIALHEIGVAIMKLRERHGMDPIDDPLPGAPESAFRIVKAIMTSFPPSAGEPAGGKAR